MNERLTGFDDFCSGFNVEERSDEGDVWLVEDLRSMG